MNIREVAKLQTGVRINYFPCFPHIISLGSLLYGDVTGIG